MDSNTFIPQAFIDKMSDILPSHLHIDDLVDACRRPLRRAIRVNTLKISVADFKLRAIEQNWSLTSIPWCPEGFWIMTEDQTNSLGNSAEHLAGLCYIQEASSMMPVSALFHFFEPSNSSVLLDAAAAPGSKTTQIAALMQNQGLVIANEFSSSRIKMLHANIQRCGINNVALTHFDARVFGEWLPETFDAILLDAPCSGEGTVRKDKYAMKNWSQASIEQITAMQKELIVSAFNALKPGGFLVYSTCTLSQEENQDVLHHLQTEYPDKVKFLNLENLFPSANKTLTQEGFLHIWPQIYDTEGFFVAAIQKVESSIKQNYNKRPAKLPFIKASSQEKANLQAYFEQQFGIKELDGILYKREQELWLFPASIEPLMDKIRFSRLGIKIAEQFGKGRKIGFKTMHEFARCFAKDSSKNNVELSAQQANEFYQGRDIHDIDCKGNSGEVFVNYRSNVIGIGKSLDTRIKNNLPRELIHDKKLFKM
ncbi:16S rRNA (cytosine(1407)-C(5))-methyltransferase RsmF [Psychromonas sp. RZ22]|uniref:16S rRNA (cytosine(1407)-C(5))-methyltransferase RsmF n=1 Tax=Psychromonas algarum TaxID=2555643 RepID=UPI001067F564|nr:16S rRNA (cytosine(1407)-C(5))-methyltransferase RsmF [Psychromonas sp. RZ22]TEW56146.1 16S rRNA (cytosine(1407)-C(5))-methyltransferase RsmF [Psychromonas sp. RZ22]